MAGIKSVSHENSLDVVGNGLAYAVTRKTHIITSCGSRAKPRYFPNTPSAKKCACNMHVTTNYMHVMVNMHVKLLLHECYMHVVRVLEMVAHVPCMLYKC